MVNIGEKWRIALVRKLANWLQSYLEYTKYTESSTIFHKWVGISTISGVLQRKVHFKFGRINIYPNLFVVLVADPGVARKTQAINYGEELIDKTPGITLSADATTQQALLEDLETGIIDSAMTDGAIYRHASLSIFSGEFESFLGQKKDNTKMVITLTDLFDCKNRPFRYRTKHSGSNIVVNPYLTILAATTPTSLASSLPSESIGAGLTTRILFIWADKKQRKVPIPEITEEIEDLKEILISDLTIISRISGEYNFSNESRKWWNVFYNKFEEQDPNRLCKDPAFMGWYSRKPLFLIKIGTIVAASKGNDLIVTPKDFEEAYEILEEIEPGMSKAFSAVGKSDTSAEVELVRGIIERHGCISEKSLLQMVWRDIDAKKFDGVIDTLTRSGRALRRYLGPKGETGTWFYYIK